RYTVGRIARLADLLFATIPAWQEQVIQDYRVPANRVFLLAIGSNIPAVDFTVTERARLPHKLGWREGENVAVAFGSYPSQALALGRFEKLLLQGLQEGYLNRMVCVGGDGTARAQDLDASAWTQRLGCG